MNRTIKFVLANALVLGAAVWAQEKGRLDAQAGAVGTTDNIVKDFNEQDAQLLMDLYASDAVLMPPSGERIEGREAIGKYWKKLMDSGVHVSAVEPVASGSSGDLRYESGGMFYFKVALGTTGKPEDIESRAKGNYLVVLRRQNDGNWLVIQHAFTENLLKGLVEDKHPKARPDSSAPQDR